MVGSGKQNLVEKMCNKLLKDFKITSPRPLMLENLQDRRRRSGSVKPTQERSDLVDMGTFKIKGYDDMLSSESKLGKIWRELGSLYEVAEVGYKSIWMMNMMNEVRQSALP